MRVTGEGGGFIDLSSRISLTLLGLTRINPSSRLGASSVGLHCVDHRDRRDEEYPLRQSAFREP